MTEICRDFSSDNITPVSPEIMAAIQAANHGTVHSYGDDDLTRRLTDIACDVFGTDLEIYPVATGTAANALALAALVPPHGGVYCHATAHIDKDECGAPEFFTGGAKLIGLDGPQGKISPAEIAPFHDHTIGRGVHQVRPAALSVSQATEWGTVYTPAEVTALSTFGKRNRLHVHMDGARFANAIVHLGCSPGAVTWQAGVDVLSFGATKNGALAAEAVIFFNRDLAAEFGYRRKRAGQLFSKMRFSSAQLIAYLEQDLWLRHAGQANAMATRLASGLLDLPGVSLLAPVQANELFVALPEALIAALEADGFGFYRWDAPITDGHGVIRLVTAWTTAEADIDGLLAAFYRHLEHRRH